jgi:PAS domain S-box-containing protein
MEAEQGAGPASHAANGSKPISATPELRILVLAPTSNDAPLTASFLTSAGLSALVCRNLPELCEEMEVGCGAVLLAEEVFTNGSIEVLAGALARQPSWSDLPIVIITGQGEAARIRRQHLTAFGPVGNVSIVERPVRPGTLISIFEFALRSRRRQYQVRDLLAEREAMSRQAEQQAKIFDTTLSAIADSAYIFDQEGRFLYANKALLDIWGLALDEVIGKTFFELPYPREMATRLHEQVRQVFETGEALRDETSYTNPQGVTGYYEYIFSPVFGRDRQVEVVAGSTRETSERRRAEEALRESDRRKDEFLAMLAHELRNPLAAVASAASLLKDSRDPESQVWGSGVIERQTRQLTHLIDDLLDVSRITTGKIRLRREVIDAAHVLERACETARPLIKERQHELDCDYDEGLWIEADPTRVEQIVLNLLTNAAKYTPAGGKIELTAKREAGELRVVVRDNGMGIAPERLPEMFQLFAQGERSIARSEGGLGIGLTIVQKLAEMHGGRIDAHSDGPNLGSTFTVYLPATVTGDPGAVRQGSRPAPTKARGLRVLVVDDNVDTAHGLARLLQRRGHEISLAHDGMQALERSREVSPEAILLDIGLPGIDGFEVVRRLRAEGCCPDTLIIAVTGYGQEEDRLRATEAGFDYHLVKPVDLEELSELLRKAEPGGVLERSPG